MEGAGGVRAKLVALGMRPDLLIQFKRHGNDATSLTCTRRDGTTTWHSNSAAGRLASILTNA